MGQPRAVGPRAGARGRCCRWLGALRSTVALRSAGCRLPVVRLCRPLPAPSPCSALPHHAVPARARRCARAARRAAAPTRARWRAPALRAATLRAHAWRAASWPRAWGAGWWPAGRRRRWLAGGAGQMRCAPAACAARHVPPACCPLPAPPSRLDGTRSLATTTSCALPACRWWELDLGPGHQLICSHYTLRHDASPDYLRCWVLQARGCWAGCARSPPGRLPGCRPAALLPA